MDSVTIVGAGTFGASLAWRLAQAGVAVNADRPVRAGRPRGRRAAASRGWCAAATAPSAQYTATARRAWALWHELEAETGAALPITPGHVLVRPARGRVGGGLGADACARRTSRSSGSTRPRRRVLHPLRRRRRRLRPVRARGRRHPRRPDAVRALAPRRAGPGRKLAFERRRVEADEDFGTDAVVWACGGWLPRPLPRAWSKLPGHTPGAAVPRRRPGAARDVPCFVDYDLAAYGTGDVDDLGVKIPANDAEGPPIDPDADLPAVSEEGEQTARVQMRGGASPRWPTPR